MKDTIIMTHTIKDTRKTVEAWKEAGYSIGIVPTMGYLHQGHASLIHRGAEENDKVIVSIFVNPMQFSTNEDLDVYPRDMDRDRRICLDQGADLIFRPDAKELYPPGFCTFVDLTGPAEGLCGKSRQGMFRGVATVVLKLLLISGADKAYFGQKDAQQLAVVKKMAVDLNIPVQIVGCPIIREDDGLAMSSRNAYLSIEERRAARCLSRSLRAGLELIHQGERKSASIEGVIQEALSEEPLARVDYIKIVDLYTIEPLHHIGSPALCAIAVYIGKTRLIDNFVWDPHAPDESI